MPIPLHPAVKEFPVLDYDLFDFDTSASDASLIGVIREQMPLRNYVKVTESFLNLISNGTTISRAVIEVIAAAAPYIHVPRHLFLGDFRPLKISNDHGILGLRAALKLAHYLPERLKLLPMVQAVWYIPKGIDICGQAVLPGFYGGYGDTVHAIRTVLGFMGLKRYPQYGDWGMFPIAVSRFDCPMTPITEGSIDERFSALSNSLFNMVPEKSLQLFLGLAEDPSLISRLRSEVLFSALTDQQERVLGGGLNTQQHPTVRARDLFDLAEFIGWKESATLCFSVIPDLALGPRHYELHDLIGTFCARRFNARQEEIAYKNQTKLSDSQRNEFMKTLLGGSQADVMEGVRNLIDQEVQLTDIIDSALITASRVIMLAEIHHLNPFEALHVFDYLNTLSTWVRECEHPRRVYAPFFAALAVNSSLPPEESRNYLSYFSSESIFPEPLPGTPEDFRDALTAHDSLKAVSLYRHSFSEPPMQRVIFEIIMEQFAIAQDNPHHAQLAVAVLEELDRIDARFRDEIQLMLASYAAGIRTDDTVYRIYQRFFSSVR